MELEKNSIPLETLIDQRDRLLVMAKNEAYTPRTRELCLIVADYFNDLISFRSKPKRERKRMIAQGICPWKGTYSWRTDEAKHDRVA